MVNRQIIDKLIDKLNEVINYTNYIDYLIKFIDELN